MFNRKEFDFERSWNLATLFIKIIWGVMAIFILSFIGFLFSGWMWSDKIHAHAVELAHGWTSVVYPNQDSTILCESVDDDSNGYITCTVVVASEATETPVSSERLNIECTSYIWFGADRASCREATPALSRSVDYQGSSGMIHNHNSTFHHNGGFHHSRSRSSRR